jgi:hypothetical protein
VLSEMCLLLKLERADETRIVATVLLSRHCEQSEAIQRRIG